MSLHMSTRTEGLAAADIAAARRRAVAVATQGRRCGCPTNQYACALGHRASRATGSAPAQERRPSAASEAGARPAAAAIGCGAIQIYEIKKQAAQRRVHHKWARGAGIPWGTPQMYAFLVPSPPGVPRKPGSLPVPSFPIEDPHRYSGENAFSPLSCSPLVGGDNGEDGEAGTDLDWGWGGGGDNREDGDDGERGRGEGWGQQGGWGRGERGE